MTQFYQALVLQATNTRVRRPGYEAIGTRLVWLRKTLELSWFKTLQVYKNIFQAVVTTPKALERPTWWREVGKVEPRSRQVAPPRAKLWANLCSHGDNGWPLSFFTVCVDGWSCCVIEVEFHV